MRRLPAAHTTARQKHEASAAAHRISVGIGPVSVPPNSGGSSDAQGVAAARDVGAQSALPLGGPDRVAVLVIAGPPAILP